MAMRAAATRLLLAAASVPFLFPLEVSSSLIRTVVELCAWNQRRRSWVRNAREVVAREKVILVNAEVDWLGAKVESLRLKVLDEVVAVAFNLGL